MRSGRDIKCCEEAAASSSVSNTLPGKPAALHPPVSRPHQCSPVLTCMFGEARFQLVSGKITSSYVIDKQQHPGKVQTIFLLLLNMKAAA